MASLSAAGANTPSAAALQAGQQMLAQAQQYVAHLQQMLTRAAQSFAPLLAGLNAAASRVNSLTAFATKLHESLTHVGRVGAYAFGILSAGVLGWVRAGLQGTGTAAMLDLHMQQLSRSIAAIFLPAVQYVSAKVQQLAQWLRSLTEAQQDSIQRWVLAAIAVSGFALALKSVVGAVIAVKAAVWALQPAVWAAVGAFTALNVVSGGVLIVIGAVATVMTAAMHKSGALGAILSALSDALESVTAAFKTLFDALGDAFGELYREVLLPMALVIQFVVVRGIETATAALRAFAAIVKVVAQEGLSALFANDFAAKVLAEAEKMRGVKKPGRGIDPGPGSFEGIDNLFKRIQMAAAEDGEEAPERAMVDLLGKIEQSAQQTAENTRRRMPVNAPSLA